MADTLFADVSEFQIEVNDQYPYRFLSFRSNDGTYKDHHFAANLAWCKHATDAGRLDGFIVYFVFEENWRETLRAFAEQVGKPHARMAVMIDMESWAGKLRGDHSAEANACREAVIDWLQSNSKLLARLAPSRIRKRVVGYANAGDFANLWPRRGDMRVVLANYSANPDFPGKIAHQYTDRGACPPFGHCDMNSADGFSPAGFARALGLTVAPPKVKPVKVKPKPAPSKPAPKPSAPAAPAAPPKSTPAAPPKAAPVSKPKPVKHAPKHARKVVHVVKSGETLHGIAAAWHVSLKAVERANPHAGHPAGHFDRLVPGDKITHP